MGEAGAAEDDEDAYLMNSGHAGGGEKGEWAQGSTSTPPVAAAEMSATATTATGADAMGHYPGAV